MLVGARDGDCRWDEAVGIPSRLQIHVEARPLCQPGAHLGMLVGGVIVHYQVDMQFGGNTGLHAAQERQELLMAMTGLALGKDGTRSNVESRKERRGAMADIVVGDALNITQAHGQHRLGAVQSLNLTFFIHAKYQGMIGRIQVKADDVPYLLDEERIGGKFEATSSVRLHGKGLKHAMHGGFGNATVVGGLANTPMGSPGGLAGEGAFEQDSNLLIGNAAWPARPQLIVRPATRCSKRCRHLPTVTLAQPKRSAISVLLWPPADHSTTLARQTSA